MTPETKCKLSAAAHEATKNRLLRTQIRQSMTKDGSFDLVRFVQTVEATYGDFEADAERGDRSMQVMADEVERLLGDLQTSAGKLELQNERFSVAINNMSHGLSMYSADNKLEVFNDVFRRIYELPDHLTEPGTARCDIDEYIGSAEIIAASETGFEEDEITVPFCPFPRFREWMLRDGRTIETTSVRLANGGCVILHEDVTARRAADARIAHMAKHDALTDLPNRVLLREEINRSLKRVKRGDSVGILCLDLDGFKNVNDTLGHPAGDELLKLVAQRLEDSVRGEDIVARLGGDEFAIVQTSEHQPVAASQLAKRIIDVLSQPFELADGQETRIGVSIGIAIAPRDGNDSDTLMMNADMALYGAKADGRGTMRLFEPRMNAIMQLRRQVEADLRTGITNGHFELFYQPLMHAKSSKVVCFEALLRWNHPTRGRISPNDFISVAEDTGTIVELGEWVLHRACNDAVSWPDHVRVAVNVSPVQVRSKRLGKMVRQALAVSGLDPKRLELEITESVLLHDTEIVLDLLHDIKSLGVRISMDDFGTGYSSLSYLRRFPFDKIKIDQSFVRDVGSVKNASVLIGAMTQLGKSLGMSTTIEGVETREQLDIVLEQGCGEIQGYLISPPRPRSDIGDMLDEADQANHTAGMTPRAAVAEAVADAVAEIVTDAVADAAADAGADTRADAA